MSGNGVFPNAAPSLSVATPPGLDAMTPAKVQLNAFSVSPPLAYDLPEQMPLPATGGPAKEEAVPRYAPQCSTSGEWLNAVLATAPYLNAQGLQQALDILDHAIKNVQQAKALEAIIAGAGARQPGAAFPGVPHLVAAELWRTQVYREQQLLLQRLHTLRLAAVAGQLQPGGAMPPPPLPSSSGRPPCAVDVTAATELLLGALAAAPAMAAAQAAAPVQAAPTAVPAGPPRSGAAAVPAPVAGRLPEAERSQRPGGRQVQTLSTSLQLLSNEDPECLFIVRRINKLGFKASRKLKQHFSAYGSVMRVLVAHSTVRQHGDPQCYARRRPSSLGFVHMATAGAVLAVLAAGEEQEVDGSLIRVQRFERQRGEQAAAEVQQEEAEEEDAETLARLEAEGWVRQQTASSGVSTAATLAEHESAGSAGDSPAEKE